MAGTRTNNTMQEGLAELIQQIAGMKLAPDADLGTLTNLETQVLQIARAPQDQLKALQQVQTQMSGPQTAGAGVAMGPAGPQAIGPPPGMPPGMPGAMPQGPGMQPPMPQMPPQGIPGAGMAAVSPDNPTLAGVRAMQGGMSRMTPGPGAVDELRRLLGK